MIPDTEESTLSDQVVLWSRVPAIWRKRVGQLADNAHMSISKFIFMLIRKEWLEQDAIETLKGDNDGRKHQETQ